MSEAAFERYDDEFQTLKHQIETSLSDDPRSQFTTNRLQQCEDLVKQMALEARSVSDSSLKRDLLAKQRTYKTQYQALQQQYEREGLLGQNGASDNAQNERLLKSNQASLAMQNETLERARRTMQETEAVALEITEELGHNRETLQSAHGRIREVGGLTGRAKRVLTQMNQRAMQQKMIVYGVGVALVLGFFIMLWAMWR
jgi:hypothetical protein